ncbi:MAG: hypothetical protein V2I25_04080 [Woeseiaceae bacterium]|jgi:hypothetical protein|nr:hypothetical protein [Woeseiaceae bacterium]
MNWSAVGLPDTLRRWRSMWAVPVAVVVAACSVPAEDSAAQTEPGTYDLVYTVTPEPSSGRVDVTLDVRQEAHLLREVRFDFDPERYSGFEGSGELQVDDDVVRWYVPAEGGSLSWQADTRRRRNDNGYDAWLDTSWGVMRAERIIPRAVSRTRKGAGSRTVLAFDLPAGWSVVTQYAPDGDRFPVENPARRYDEPSGWLVMGRLGVRLDRIGGTRIVVAGPEDNNVRRLDILTFLNWTLPDVFRLVPAPPERLTVISAGDPMWRGGLSASDSLYIHAERPLVSENGTSTLLHEVLHVVLGLWSKRGYDWIVEGLAEYYSVEVLRRSGGLSAARTDKAFASLAEWARETETLCKDPSTGSRTAFAATLFAALDAEIRDATAGRNSLDDVLALLLARESDIDLDDLVTAATEVMGGMPESLGEAAIPGCAPRPPPTGGEPS